jgi:transposase
LGRSRGGFSTKVHIAVDGLGNPVEFILTAGQAADVTQAEPLIQSNKAEAYILDKAYDSDAVVAAAKRRGAEAVIPPKKNRKVPRDYDKHVYKERKKVEWFINLIKQYRRVATRYEKTARNFLGFVHVASIMVLLR